ncbi:UspA domain protein [Citreicella sp. SE45]|uniref:universal stress protein n=1 Tax=Salipiger sp. HF18 TaxID=2721557 RepID=UPI0001B8C6C4|nr:universal stress protein [Salipiger sp. HF18]EEX16074.1 UspA domain protein [Citreicella sp. SE45]MAU44093.1 universal stress protein [Salipiger sp.]NIY97908.1 universal stress protein [Salipiger sp. HF18]NVK61265.1 universal stress protein [Paracoccaceae bacterium]
MFRTILLAVDMNDLPESGHVAEAAVRMAQCEGATLHVVNVIPGSGMAMVGSYLGPEQEHRIRSEAREKLESWAAEAIPSEVRGSLHVTQGTIYHEIIKAAKEVGADAIVVGANRPALSDYLVGPNAARVVRHAPQSVLVIR